MAGERNFEAAAKGEAVKGAGHRFSAGFKLAQRFVEGAASVEAGLEEGLFVELDVGAATGATRTNGPFMSQTDEQFRAAFDKFWGYTHVVRQGVPHLVEDASITLVSGTPARKCNPGMISVSCTGCAVEGFVRALTPELAPIRINGVAPGIIDTPMFDHFGEKKAATLDAIGANFPLGRVGQPEEVAEAILLCMSNTYMTGVVIDVDGGALLP